MVIPKARAETLLEVHELSKHFGPVRAVDSLSFAVQRGEIVGLLGPNGAGKTTVMRMIVGYLIPTSGSVRLAGGDIFREGPRLKTQLGYLPENMPLYGEMTVGEYLGMTAQLKGLKGEPSRMAIERVVSILGLAPVWRRPTSQLSRGYRQRVGLSQCLLTDPAILVLDEPATGLDPNQISELRHLIRSWRERKAILLSTHILAEALMLCDRVLILSRGRLVASGTPQALSESGDGMAATEITIRGSRENPIAGLEGSGEISAVRREAIGSHVIWRLEGSLNRAERLALMSHLARGGWEILEWNSGLSALEQAFRRLTLEEGTQRQDE
ncbi:MAG: ABC transporter ATP-binding protein [Candidatus Eisenbacteria sp.]|nr:ABC transporter ATP-binding protein [Candidatus Eisenbacteria bacterium]